MAPTGGLPRRSRQVGDTWQISDAYRGHTDAHTAREVMTRGIGTHWGITPKQTLTVPPFVASSNKPNTIGNKSAAKTSVPNTTANAPGPLRTKQTGP